MRRAVTVAVFVMAAGAGLSAQTAATATPGAATPPSGTPAPTACIALTCANPPLTPPAHVEVVYPLPGGANNAADIVKILQPNDTEFAYVQNGESQIVIFCKSKSCSHLREAETAIDKLATKKDPPSTPPAGPDFTRRPLLLCAPATLSSTLPATAYDPATCTTRPIQGANAAEIVTAFKDNKKFTVAAAGDTEVTITCKEAGKCSQTDVDGILGGIDQLARPRHPYTEDVAVPFGAAPKIVDPSSPSLSTWRALNLTFTAAGDDLVRIESDAPLSSMDRLAVLNAISEAGFGSPETALLKRLFYTPADAVAAKADSKKPVGNGLAIADSVVYTDSPEIPNSQRLLALIDLPRPEVLMNFWSLSASGKDGKQVEKSGEDIRQAVSASNDALEYAVQYGWEYLSEQMKSPEFFDPVFRQYITNKYVGGAVLSDDQRREWGICPAGRYCLGYSEAFSPLYPNLSSILLGMIASKKPTRSVLTTIACMEGKYEVYPECFPGRKDVTAALEGARVNTPAAQEDRACLRETRKMLLEKMTPDPRMSCADLDMVALEAQRMCGVAQSFPMSCFTLQATKSFFPENSFTTFTLSQLNSFAEERIADAMDGSEADDDRYQSTPLGLLRGAVADFLFNYKMASQFPRDFTPYDLTHSAQKLNSLFNPLVVAFNQDVTAFTRDLMHNASDKSGNRNHWFQAWRSGNVFRNDGMVTVRGLSGNQSIVDTTTQSFFDATQPVSFSQLLQSLTGSGGSGSGTAAAANTNSSAILDSALNRDWAAKLLKAITPEPATAKIGRNLTLTVTPNSLAGASAAELVVDLKAGEEGTPSIYSNTSPGTKVDDAVSRVSKHNTNTKVRVESVKLFEVSSFTALLERPRSKFPLVPPFIELPIIGSLASVPLPRTREFHRSTVIVSAILVPTASDLAYGMVFAPDRGFVWDRVSSPNRPDLSKEFRLYRYTSLSQLRRTPVGSFHKAMIQCLANHQPDYPTCQRLTFDSVAPAF